MSIQNYFFVHDAKNMNIKKLLNYAVLPRHSNAGTRGTCTGTVSHSISAKIVHRVCWCLRRSWASSPRLNWIRMCVKCNENMELILCSCVYISVDEQEKKQTSRIKLPNSQICLKSSFFTCDIHIYFIDPYNI